MIITRDVSEIIEYYRQIYSQCPAEELYSALIRRTEELKTYRANEPGKKEKTGGHTICGWNVLTK